MSFMLTDSAWAKPSLGRQHLAAPGHGHKLPGPSSSRSLSRRNSTTSQRSNSHASLANDGHETVISGRAFDPNAHASSLCRVLGVSQPQFMSMVGRHSQLFMFTPEALKATLGALSDLTGLQHHQLPDLAAADPALLLQPHRLKRNMKELAQALGVSPRQVEGMAGRDPAVLALSGGQAAERLGALSELFQPAPLNAVVSEVLRSPARLLVPEPGEVRGQVQALECALAEIPGDWTLPQPSTAAATSQPAHCSSSPAPPPPQPALRALLSPLLLRRPSMLASDPHTLASRVGHIACKARTIPARVLAAAPAEPNLLAVSSTAFDALCARIADELKLSGTRNSSSSTAATSAPSALAAGAAAAAVANASQNGTGSVCPNQDPESEAAALLVAVPALMSQTPAALGTRWRNLHSLCVLASSSSNSRSSNKSSNSRSSNKSSNSSSSGSRSSNEGSIGGGGGRSGGITGSVSRGLEAAEAGTAVTADRVQADSEAVVSVAATERDLADVRSAHGRSNISSSNNNASSSNGSSLNTSSSTSSSGSSSSNSGSSSSNASSSSSASSSASSGLVADPVLARAACRPTHSCSSHRPHGGSEPPPSRNPDPAASTTRDATSRDGGGLGVGGNNSRSSGESGSGSNGCCGSGNSGSSSGSSCLGTQGRGGGQQTDERTATRGFVASTEVKKDEEGEETDEDEDEEAEKDEDRNAGAVLEVVSWEKRLANLEVSERAELLAQSYGAMARLRFLVDHGKQGEVDLLEVVRAPAPLFLAQYPAFIDWLRKPS